MGYAVRPLRRSGQHKARQRARRFHLNWVPAGGSLAYVITMSENVEMTDSGTLVTFSTGVASAGGRVRIMMRGSGVRRG